MICPECGIGEVVPVSDPKRTWPHRTIPDLRLPSSVQIPTCSHCGEQWIDDATGRLISEAAERAFKDALQSKAEAAIQALQSAGHSQRALERLLGLSQGYMSKLTGADRDPSPTLVAALMLLADAPIRVARLREMWRVERAAMIPKSVRPIAARTLANSSESGPVGTSIRSAEVPVSVAA